MEASRSIPKIAYNEAEAAEYLNVSVPLLRKYRREGGGPEFRKIGKRVLYDIGDLKTFWHKCKISR